MKKKLTLLVLALFAIGQISAQKIKIAGSSVPNEFTIDIAAAYINKYPRTIIAATGGNSIDGYAALLRGDADIAQMERKLREEEKMALNRDGKRVIERPVAINAFAIVVNKANKVGKITKEQLEDVLTGKITNWKELGGDDMKIILYGREDFTAGAELLRTRALAPGRSIAPTITRVKSYDDIDDRMELFKGGASYVPISHVGLKSKALDLSFDGGKTYYAPTMENTKSEAYPLYSTLYYTYYADAPQLIHSFVDYSLSGAGQRHVIRHGFAPAE